MTREETKSLIDYLQGNYPSWRFKTQHEATSAVDAWQYTFQKFTLKQMQEVAQIFIFSSESEFAPTPSQLIGIMRKMRKTDDNALTEGEVWRLITKAASNSTYKSVEEFNHLPKEVQKLVGSPQALKQMAIEDEATFSTVTKSLILRNFREIKQHQEELAKLPEHIRLSLEG